MDPGRRLSPIFSRYSTSAARAAAKKLSSRRIEREHHVLSMVACLDCLFRQLRLPCARAALRRLEQPRTPHSSGGGEGCHATMLAKRTLANHLEPTLRRKSAWQRHPSRLRARRYRLAQRRRHLHRVDESPRSRPAPSGRRARLGPLGAGDPPAAGHSSGHGPSVAGVRGMRGSAAP